MLSRIVVISLVLSFQSLALAGELPSNNIEIISFDAGTTPAPVLIANPTIKSSSEAVKVVDIGHSSNLTTVIPVINVALPPSTKLPTVHHESVVVLPANNSIVEPTHRFDGEGVTLVNDVVSKVLDTSKMNSSDVKVIDAASPVKITTIKPSIEVHLETTKAPIANHSGILTADGVLNDQKTVFVLLDDAGKTTVAPKKAHNATQVPVHLNVTLAKSTAHPKVTVKIEGTTVTTVKPTAASSPVSTTPKQTHVLLVSSTSAPSASKTVVLIEKGKVTTGSPSLALLVKPTLSPIIKPLETFEQVLERQEKEKHDLDVKFRLEREKLIKDMRKKQDDIDAQNAIKALQNQRQATSSTSRVPDSKLHQLEHDRQMAIDPIGHTIKHQQYEISKQRVLLGRK